MITLTKIIKEQDNNSYLFILTDDVKQEDIPVKVTRKELFKELYEAESIPVSSETKREFADEAK